MSKERARRRAEREREAGIKAAARAAHLERAERAAARRAGVRRLLVLPSLATSGKRSGPGGAWAQRRSRQDGLLVAMMAVVAILICAAVDGWFARVAVVLLAGLFYPVARVLIFGRR